MIEKDLNELRSELQDLKERLKSNAETFAEDDTTLSWAVELVDKLLYKENVKALQVNDIKNRIQDLQNAKTAVEITEHARYFHLLAKRNEELEKENDFLRRINTVQAERIKEMIIFEELYLSLENKIKALEVNDDRNKEPCVYCKTGFVEFVAYDDDEYRNDTKYYCSANYCPNCRRKL